MSQPNASAADDCTRTTGPGKKSAPRRDSHPVLTASMRKFDLEEKEAAPSQPPRKKQPLHSSSVADIVDSPHGFNGSSSTTTTTPKKRKRAGEEDTTPPHLPLPSPSTKRRIAPPASQHRPQLQLQLSDSTESESDSQSTEEGESLGTPSPPPERRERLRYYTPEPSFGLRLEYTAHGPRYYQNPPTPSSSSSSSPPTIVHVQEEEQQQPINNLSTPPQASSAHLPSEHDENQAFNALYPSPPIPTTNAEQPATRRAMWPRERGAHLAWHAVRNPEGYAHVSPPEPRCILFSQRSTVAEREEYERAAALLCGMRDE